MSCRFLYLLISFLLVCEVKTCFQSLHLEALVKTFPSRSNYGFICPSSSATMTSSNTPTSSSTMTPTPSSTRTPAPLSSTPSPSSSSSSSNTASSSSSNTPSPSSTNTPSSSPTNTQSNTPSSSSTRTPSSSPSNTPTSSPSNTPSSSSTNTPTSSSTNTPTSSSSNTLSQTASPSITPSRTASRTRSISRSPSTTPSPAVIELLVTGSIPVGNAWTRSQSVFTEIAFAFQFRVIPQNSFIGPQTTNFTVNPPYLNGFSFSDLVLLYERDINCGPSPNETTCSCEYNCGTTGQLRCCDNFHRATLQEYDGDGQITNGFSPWFSQNGNPSYNFKVVCNNASIPHFWVGIVSGNGVNTVANDGTPVFFQAIPDTFSIYKPFIPAGTLGDAQKSHGYCLPDFSVIPQEFYATINKDSDCTRTQFCADTANGVVSGQTVSFGGCYCDRACGLNGDCCLSVADCYYQSGTVWSLGSTIFAANDASNCSLGLVDCNGTCRGQWAFNAIGDGICDDGRRGIDLNCLSPRLSEYSFDGGDCYCEIGYEMGCNGSCIPVGSGKVNSCVCTDMDPLVAISDCDGNCVPYIPTIFCSGQSEYSLDCPQVYSIVRNSTSLAAVVGLVCKVIPSACVVPIPAYVGDFVCDSNIATYNSATCNYDGGDCCAQTCIARATSVREFERCGSAGYTCVDPLFN